MRITVKCQVCGIGYDIQFDSDEWKAIEENKACPNCGIFHTTKFSHTLTYTMGGNDGNINKCDSR